MKYFSDLKKNLKKDFSALKTIKVALLGDTATQLLNQALRGEGYDRGFDIQLFEADFDQIERQVLDPASELYEFNADVVILFHATHKFLNKYGKLPAAQHNALADEQINLVDSLYAAIQQRSKAKVIYYNYPEIHDAVFGSYANKTVSSFLFQLRKFNYELMLYAAKSTNIFICDLSSIQNQLGKSVLFQTSVYINTEMVLSIDPLPLIAARTLDVIDAIYGRFKKCLIIDLDNTMWGGIIGDDGLENIMLGSLGIGKAFTEFQYWMKKLKNRGIILAVCSKNTESVAKEPFEKHPDMVLHLDDIAVFVANWENKVDNIRQIQQILNIGFDSMVFLDDNPFERNIVRENIAGITVPELPDDPADYLEYLYTLNLFETASFTNEDQERTTLYQTEAKRLTEQQSFVNEDDFLKNLQMTSVVESFNKFNGPRVAQLSQRSNQFNLRTVRYTEADVLAIGSKDSYHGLSFTLKDRFGDNGLIGVVVMKKETNDTLFIENWLMSCRVLKRGMENFMLNAVVDTARKNGFKYLSAEYLPTPKNKMVKDHYQKLGFDELAGNRYTLELNKYEQKQCFIALQAN